MDRNVVDIFLKLDRYMCNVEYCKIYLVLSTADGLNDILLDIIL